MTTTKDEARRAYSDQRSQDTEGGCQEPVGFVTGYLACARSRQSEIDELKKENLLMRECLGKISTQVLNQEETNKHDISVEYSELDQKEGYECLIKDARQCLAKINKEN